MMTARKPPMALVCVALFFSLCVPVPHCPAQTLHHVIVGGSGDDLGYSVSGVGDVNGDGFDDFVIGARYAGTGEAHVHVCSGADCSLLWSTTDESGPGTGGALGWSVAAVGDVDGDGVPDIAAGAPSESVLRGDDGSVKILSGADGRVLLSVHGDREGDRLGHRVAGIGDANGDGVPDFAAGTQAPLSRPGYARVYSGADGSTLLTLWDPAPPDRSGMYSHFGSSVSGAGDVDGDGFADVIVGAPLDDGNGRDSGCARVYSGRDGRLLHVFRGDLPFDYLGFSVSRAGDVDGDGFDDVILGASGWDDPWRGLDDVGAARIHSGRTGATLRTFTGDVRDRFFGISVSGAGDVNGDGFDDVIVGTFGYPVTVTSHDYASVFSGRDGALLFTVRGRRLHDGFGWAVGAAGDVDADGFADVIVGAYGDDLGGLRAGTARVYLGRSDSGMVLARPDPGAAGVTNVLEVTGVTPGGAVRFAYGRGLGQTPVPGCAPVILSLRTPRIGPFALADAAGRASAQVFVPASQAGQTYRIQAIDVTGCRVSNLVRVTLR